MSAAKWGYEELAMYVDRDTGKVQSSYRREIAHVIEDGWEPFAVTETGFIDGGGDWKIRRTYFFRKEIEA